MKGRNLKYLLTTTALAGTVLASFCLLVPPTPEAHLPLMLLACMGGALCAYVYRRCSLAESGLEKSAIVGCSAGLIGGLLCFGSTAIILTMLRNSDVVLNVRSFNLAVIGVIELTLSSGLGGLIIQLLLRGHRNSVPEKYRLRTLILCVVTTVLTCAVLWVLHRLSLMEPQPSSSAFALSSSQSGIPTVTLCELLANPQFYDVKVIRVEAILVANHGDRSLYDPSCITMEPMVGVQPDPSLQYQPEGGVDRAFYDLVEQKSDDKTASARMIMVGRFEGPNFLKDGRKSRFQHQLVLMKLERAESVAQKTSAPPQP